MSIKIQKYVRFDLMHRQGLEPMDTLIKSFGV